MNRSTALLGCIVLVGILLRGWQASESFWIDELHTSWAVSGSLREVADRAALGNQSPLYFWLAWFSARLPLSPEIALRLPSLLAGCALPIATFALAKKLLPREETSDDAAPLLAAALVVIDPLAIFFSQEARPYALLQLVVVTHFWLLLQILERPTWLPRTIWVLTGALLVHLHYTGALILVAECVSLVALTLLTRKSSGGPVCGGGDNQVALCYSCWIDLGALALLLLPAIPGILAVAARRENWKEFVKPQAAIEILRIFPWTPAIIVLSGMHRRRPVLSPRSLVILAGWLLVPLALTWLCTRLDIAALFHKRYLIAVWPASILAVALCARLGTNRALQLAIAAGVFAVSLANSGLVQNWRRDGRLMHERTEDWRPAVRELNSVLQPDSAIVLLDSGLIEADELPRGEDPRLVEYCLYPLHGAYSIPEEARAYPLTNNSAGKYLLPAARASLRSASTRSIWLIGRGSSGAREETLAELEDSTRPTELWSPQPPQVFGSVYLQQVIVRER